jgi:hypothetical protein
MINLFKKMEQNKVKIHHAKKNLRDGWIDVNVQLPDELETVFISNGKGWTSIGCVVYVQDCGWVWAETNGIIYEENGKIVSECEIDDLDVKFWHKLPKPPFA